MEARHSVIIFDTTLRDGEQSPRVFFDTETKCQIALLLEECGVDVLEAGFPASGKKEKEAVNEIAKLLDKPVVTALARCLYADLDAAIVSLEHAKKKRVHCFIAGSDIHLEHKLKMSRENALKQAVESILYLKKEIDDIEFSIEDAGRTDREYLKLLVSEAAKAGARTINIPDTVGYMLPQEMYQLISELKKTLSNYPELVLSTHCHNDLGLAVANSLAAFEAGARQIECTINGIGERAGNCALEEIVMILKTRSDLYNINCNIKTNELFPLSQFVSKASKISVQANKAIVGANAFAHESGIHQHGFLNKRETYEIIRPEIVGWIGEEICLGKHSGRFAVNFWLEKRGTHLDAHDFESFFQRFKCLSEEKGQINDEDMQALFEHFIKHSHMI